MCDYPFPGKQLPLWRRAQKNTANVSHNQIMWYVWFIIKSTCINLVIRLAEQMQVRLVGLDTPRYILCLGKSLEYEVSKLLKIQISHLLNQT